MFSFDISEKLKKILVKLNKKDPVRAAIIYKKIEEIVTSADVEHYKNLCANLSDYRRVHVAKSFVLFFNIDVKRRFIWFTHLKHHDDAYK